MRSLIFGLIVALALPCTADAASSSWLTDLFGPQQAAHKATHRPVPAKPPAKAAPVPLVADKTDETPPIPLPRPRPDLRAAAANDTAAAAPATPVPAPAPTPAPSNSTPPAVPLAPPPQVTAAPSTAAPQSTAPTSDEGESTTPKPPRIFQTACPAVISGLVEAKPLPPISDGQCGTQSPLSVSGLMVNGRSVPLSQAETFGCEMATDLPGWVADVDNYIWSTQNTRIKSVVTEGSYECRPRNVEGGSSVLSEHGRADALDVAGFTLEDGRQLTVTKDYSSDDPKISKLMHFAHDAACTRFTTVLGPDANALHHDHFHLDLGCHGKTCTYRLCE